MNCDAKFYMQEPLQAKENPDERVNQELGKRFKDLLAGSLREEDDDGDRESLETRKIAQTESRVFSSMEHTEGKRREQVRVIKSIKSG